MIANQINTNNTTCRHRYPGIFKDIASITEGFPSVASVSVGCSTGEEVRSLKELHPHWTCHGVEIDDNSRASAVAQDPEGFYCKDIYSLRESSYDLLLCMSVLCLQDSKAFTFANFEDIVTDFCRVLKVGGILVLNNVQYNVLDSPELAMLLEPIPNKRGNGAGYVTRYNSLGQNPHTPTREDPYMFRLTNNPKLQRSTENNSNNTAAFLRKTSSLELARLTAPRARISERHSEPTKAAIVPPLAATKAVTAGKKTLTRSKELRSSHKNMVQVHIRGRASPSQRS
jgi:SAM-dependent methyltransferase